MENDWYEKEQLHFAASDGYLSRVKQLVESGYDVNLFDDLSYAPLHYAAIHGRRGFFDALEAEPTGAAEALEQLKALFAIEEDIRNLKLLGRCSAARR